jgi:hypothetical protein
MVKSPTYGNGFVEQQELLVVWRVRTHARRYRGGVSAPEGRVEGLAIEDHCPHTRRRR